MRLTPSATPAAGPSSQEYRLRQACKELEGVFLRHLVAGMRATVPEGGLLGDSPGADLYSSLADEALAGQLTESGGLGLADTLYEQLAPRVIPSAGRQKTP